MSLGSVDIRGSWMTRECLNVDQIQLVVIVLKERISRCLCRGSGGSDRTVLWFCGSVIF